MFELYKDSEVKEILLSKIRLRYNYRMPKHNPSYIELRESIRKHGLIKPILLREVNEDYEIIDGQRRYLAYKDLKKRHIPCIIYHNIDEITFLQLQLAGNIQRKIKPHQTAMRLWEFYLTLIEKDSKKKLDKSLSYYHPSFEWKNYLTMEAFSERLNIPSNIIRTAFLYINTSDRIKQMVGEGTLNYTTAAEIGRLPTYDEQEWFLSSAKSKRKDGRFFSSKIISKRITAHIHAKSSLDELTLIKEELDEDKYIRLLLNGEYEDDEDNGFSVYIYFTDLNHILNGMLLMLNFENEEKIGDLHEVIKGEQNLVKKIINEVGSLEGRINNIAPKLLTKIKTNLSSPFNLRDKILSKEFGNLEYFERLLKNSEIRLISIKDCTIDETNIRMKYDEEYIEALAKSMKILGQLTPIIVRKVGEKYIVCAGNCRTKAAEKAGLKCLEVFVLGIDEITGKTIQIIEDFFEDPSPYETAQAIFNIIKIGEDMAREKGATFNRKEFIDLYMSSYGRSRIKNAIKFVEGLDDRIKTMVELGIIPYSTGLDLAEITEKEGQDYLKLRYCFAISSLINNEPVKETREKIRMRNQQNLGFDEEDINTLAKRALTLKFKKSLEHFYAVDKYIKELGKGICLKDERLVIYVETLKMNLEKLLKNFEKDINPQLSLIFS